MFLSVSRGINVFAIFLLVSVSSVYANCEGTSDTPSLDSTYSSGWGIDLRNTRYQQKSSITSDNAADLQLQWAYGLSTMSPRSYPLITEDTVFIGDGGRGVVALDRNSGCARLL